MGAPSNETRTVTTLGNQADIAAHRLATSAWGVWTDPLQRHSRTLAGFEGNRMDRVYQFGEVEVRSAERRVLVSGHPVSVGTRGLDLLLALIERRDRVVTKDELLSLVWPGLVVEETNIKVQVSTLRKIIGSDVVSTIPGHGYRFVAALA